MTKGEPPAGQADGTPARRSHVPGDGTAAADAIEHARREMLHDVRTRKRTRIGADALMEALIRQGADTLFSYPGGVILPIYDILGDYPEIRHILVRHEQGGAHAADGYARASGKVGVCMGTSGPGATNLVTGIGTAQLDSVPMVAITGNVPGVAHRQGRVPGDRHQRHHAADDQAQLPGAQRRRHPACHRRGLLHREARASRARARGHHQGRPAAGDARRAPLVEDVIAGLPGFRPNLEGHPKQLKLAAKEIAAGEAPAHPRGARRADRRGLGRAEGLRREDADPGRLVAAGHRRHGRGASAGLRLHGDARLEAREPGDPVARTS